MYHSKGPRQILCFAVVVCQKPPQDVVCKICNVHIVKLASGISSHTGHNGCSSFPDL